MKRLKLVLAAIIIYLSAFSQTWNGLSISGSYLSFKTKLEAKGFKFSNRTESVSTFYGRVNSQDLEVLVVTTPTTNIVAKLVIYLPKQIGWYSLKSDYETYKELFTKKYGEPESFEYFKDPYYEGDSYEMSAVTLEKCNYISFWLNSEPNTTIALSISKYKQVEISYENILNMEIRKQELDKINNKIF